MTESVKSTRNSNYVLHVPETKQIELRVEHVLNNYPFILFIFKLDLSATFFRPVIWYIVFLYYFIYSAEISKRFMG